MAELEREVWTDNPRDALIAQRIQGWLRKQDPRKPLGCIMLVQYDDGFSVQYLGPEAPDQDELIRRVAYIGDELRDAAPDIGFYR